MADIVGKIPEFTSEEAQPERVLEEVVQPTEEVTEEVAPTEKETPIPPIEKPTEQEIVGVASESQGNTEIVALQTERVKLLKEITELRGQRREIKQEQIAKVEQQIDDLKEVNPDDVNLIDRVLRAKGYVNKAEASQMFYEAVKQEELNKFLEKYPEYKPENDREDINWSSLQKEIGYYKMPTDPHQIRDVLERAHRSTPKIPSTNIAPQRRQVQIASVGGGGAQRSAPSKALNPHLASLAESHLQGFTDEEMKTIKNKL